MVLQMEFLTLTTKIEAHEMAQMLKGKFPFDRHLEWQWTFAIGTRELSHFDHHLTRFGLGINQFSANGEVVVTLRKRVVQIVLIRGKGAWFPNTRDLEVEVFTIPTTGIHHPKMGVIHGEMTAHQG
ncbi:hypothetical protein WH5701_16750 [Synechococcus sp. WH 5701]|nr:hypothetical protein WH5701_16750 [Synechococcus sp. WH 5701]